MGIIPRVLLYWKNEAGDGLITSILPRNGEPRRGNKVIPYSHLLRSFFSDQLFQSFSGAFLSRLVLYQQPKAYFYILILLIILLLQSHRLLEHRLLLACCPIKRRLSICILLQKLINCLIARMDPVNAKRFIATYCVTIDIIFMEFLYLKENIEELFLNFQNFHDNSQSTKLIPVHSNLL